MKDPLLRLLIWFRSVNKPGRHKLFKITPLLWPINNPFRLTLRKNCIKLDVNQKLDNFGNLQQEYAKTTNIDQIKQIILN
jgi:hypothetical protein